MPNIETKFFTFNQNNSGGSFDYDEDRGITHYVIVEGVDKTHAVARAEEIGLYWDGCYSGRDCDCCGDRWHVPYDEGSDFPSVYGKNVREDGAYKSEYGGGWMKEGHEVAIHPITGPIEWYGVIK